MRSQVSSDSSGNISREPPPALLISTCKPPYTLTVWATAASTADRSVTSHGRKVASPPSARMRLLDRAAFRFAARENRRLRSFLREEAGGGFSDSAVAAGNQGHFVVQPAWHACVSFPWAAWWKFHFAGALSRQLSGWHSLGRADARLTAGAYID